MESPGLKQLVHVQLDHEPVVTVLCAAGKRRRDLQRLEARICEKCKEAYYPPREVLLHYFQEEGLTDVPFYRGRGCTHCRGTGYRGRVAFHELVLVTDEIRQLINERKSAQEITRAAERVGFKPLRYDGLRKVLLGLTTITEIEQNSSFEWAT